MQADRFSRMALVMAFFRALETARPVSTRLLNDAFAATVLPPLGRMAVTLARLPLLGSAIAALVDRRWPGARTSGIARTRLIDDWIAAAVRGGTRQVVILGAGFDSRAWRLPALSVVPVFELDHPATSQQKRQRLMAAGLDPARVVQVAIDFDRQPLGETLAISGFEGRRPTAVVWEGVTNYLSAEAVDAVLRWVGGLAPDSTLAFTYVHSDVLTTPQAFDGAERILASVAKAGESWTYGIDPAQLARRLKSTGLTLVEDLGADDYRSRYWHGTACRWCGYAFYRIALAAVSSHAEA